MHQRWKSVLREAIAYVNEANILRTNLDWAGDTDGLFQFAIENGYIPER